MFPEITIQGKVCAVASCKVHEPVLQGSYFEVAMADAQTEHRLQPRTALRGHLTGAEPCNIKLDRYARHGCGRGGSGSIRLGSCPRRLPVSGGATAMTDHRSARPLP